MSMSEGQESVPQAQTERKEWDWTDEEVKGFVDELSNLAPPIQGFPDHATLSSRMSEWVKENNIKDKLTFKKIPEFLRDVAGFEHKPPVEPPPISTPFKPPTPTGK